MCLSKTMTFKQYFRKKGQTTQRHVDISELNPRHLVPKSKNLTGSLDLLVNERY